MDFTRERKLSVTHLLGHVLTQVASCNLYGAESSSQQYCLRWNEVMPLDLEPASRSSVCEARQKLDWKAFEHLLHQAEMRDSPLALWKGHRVRAVDGTKLQLPHSPEILSQFPQRMNGQTLEHYPLAMLMTAVNVFTGQPTTATLTHKSGSERAQLLELLERFDSRDICLLDRGFEGPRVWAAFEKRGQCYVGRIRAMSMKLVPGSERVVERRTCDPLTGEITVLKVRIIVAHELADGKPLVIATNLLDSSRYPTAQLIELYGLRWKAETLYYRVKSLLQITQFHAKNTNGVRQEIWANLLLLSLSALALHAAEHEQVSSKKGDATRRDQPNFKNAFLLVGYHLPWLIQGFQPPSHDGAARLERLFHLIRKSRCPIQPGRSYPRYSRRSLNKWAFAKRSRLKHSSLAGSRRYD